MDDTSLFSRKPKAQEESKFPLENQDVLTFEAFKGTPTSSKNQTYFLPKDQESEQAQKYAVLGASILQYATDTLITHPCHVIRRQCQVHVTSFRYHLGPFTLVPVLTRMIQRQGPGFLWKSCHSVLVMKVLTGVTETLLAEFTPLPRELPTAFNLKSLLQHLALKGLAFMILTPFYCASLAETVQSDIASERPGVVDLAKESFARAIQWGQSRRLLPVWLLAVPTAAHRLAHYLVSNLAQSLTSWVMSSPVFCSSSHAQRQDLTPSSTEQQITNQMAVCLGNLAADILLYPAETVLHRLYLQGTRTIVDNLDTGYSVTPVITTYDGPLDCFNTIVRTEGAAGLFKGFGALTLQYTLHYAILHLSLVMVRSFHQPLPPTQQDSQTSTRDNSSLLPL